MHPYKRSLRVGDLIREEVADIIMHKIRDPRLGFVTVTEVKASDDLKHAQVYVSVLEDAKRAKTHKILKSSAKFIRSELAKRVKIKFIPELIFKLDESIEYGAKIEKMLNEIKSSKTPESDPESGDNSSNDNENLK